MLHDTASFFRALSDCCPVGVFATDTEGCCTYLNPQAQAILDFTLEANLGQSWLEWLDPDDRASIRLVWRQQVFAGSEWSGQCRLRSPEGETRWVNVRSSPLRDSQETVIGSVNTVEWMSEAEIAREMTLAKRTEAALRESEQRLRLAQRAAKIGTWEWDVRTGAVAWSEGIWELLGLEPSSEALGVQPWIDLIHPDDRERTLQNLEAAFADAEDYYDEFRILQPDGSVRWLASQGKLIRDLDGQVERLLGINIDIGDRKRVEEALENNLAQLEAVLYHMTEGLIVLDPQGNILMMNPAALTMHEFSSIEETRQPISVLAPLFEAWDSEGQFLDLADWPICRAVAGETFSGRRLQIRRVDTGRRWVAQYGGTSVRNKAGEAILAIVIISDVTAQHEVEEALRAHAERLSLALTASNMGDWLWDAQTDLVTFSERSAEIFGIPVEPSLTWAELSERLHEDDRDRTRLAVEQAIANHSDYDVEYRVLQPDGTVRWVAAKGRAQYDVAGQALRMRGVVQDVSDRKQAETEIALLNQDLQNRVDELQTLFDVIPIGILISQDVEFKRVQANPACAEILGISKNGNASATPPEGTPPYKIFQNGKQIAPDETPLRYAAIHGVVVERAEVDILRYDGTLFNLFGYAAPLFDIQGKPRGAIAAFLDITERKRAEAEREQLLERERVAREAAETANRVKDEFLAVLSHELRTPLNPILGWTQMLRTGLMDAEKTAIALETIERNVKLQTQLIEDLLDISRILQGKLTLHVVPVDLATVIAAAAETVRLAAEAKSIQMQMWIEPAVGQVMGDPNRLQQVIWNLLSNAVKFTPAEGQICVRLERVDTNAQIQVSDTGMGISAEFLPYVFETFRQADGTTTRRFGGLGVGLSIVRHITEMHGGSVQAVSSGENQGATFTVRLPLMQPTLPANSPDLLVPDAVDLSGLNILVVDDEPDTRDLISFVLGQSGAQVTPVGSGREVLEILGQQVPDLLVCDIGMPEMDGYELIRQIRSGAIALAQQVPAIALTAYAGEFNQQRAIEAGFQQHLAKPVEPQALVKTVMGLMQANAANR